MFPGAGRNACDIIPTQCGGDKQPESPSISNISISAEDIAARKKRRGDCSSLCKKGKNMKISAVAAFVAAVSLLFALMGSLSFAG
jgi:hypothetical protein